MPVIVLVVGVALGRQQAAQRCARAGAGALPPQVIDRLAAGGGVNPGHRVPRLAITRPVLDGGDERLLQHVLRELKVARTGPNERGDDASGIVTRDPLNGGERRRLRIRRIAIAPRLGRHCVS